MFGHHAGKRLFAGLAMLAGSVTGAQDRPVVFGARAEIVRVPVMVTGKRGDPVRDLQASDFRLYEDGRARRIEAFWRATDPAGLPEMDVSLVLLLDTSGSMRAVVRRARSAAVRFLERVPRVRVRAIVSFDRDIRRWKYDPAKAESIFDDVLHSAARNGPTPLYSAITAGALILSGDPARQVMVLLTDGEEFGSTVNLQDLLSILRESNVVLYAISYASGPSRQGAVLRQLARTTGGTVFDGLSGDADLQFERIAADIGAQYVLGFTPTDRAPGRYRRLKVGVSDARLRVRYREGYEIPNEPGVRSEPPER